MYSLEHVVLWDEEFKSEIIQNVKTDGVVDVGIRPLVDAINSISHLATMNSCQGGGEPHCGFAYVDFYVLYHDYGLAHNLFIYLIREFSDQIMCQLEYEDDLEFEFRNDEEYADSTGMIRFRYRIKMHDETLIPAVTRAVKKFSSATKPHMKLFEQAQ